MSFFSSVFVNFFFPSSSPLLSSSLVSLSLSLSLSLSFSSLSRAASIFCLLSLTFNPIFSAKPVRACLIPEAGPAPSWCCCCCVCCCCVCCCWEETPAGVVGADVAGDVVAVAVSGSSTAVGVVAVATAPGTASAAVTGFPEAVVWTAGTPVSCWGRCMVFLLLFFCFGVGRRESETKEEK